MRMHKECLQDPACLVLFCGEVLVREEGVEKLGSACTRVYGVRGSNSYRVVHLVLPGMGVLKLW